MIKKTGRDVNSLVNTTDQLFAESAGIDVKKAVPKIYTLNAKPMLAYLRDPPFKDKHPVRRKSYNRQGTNATVTQYPACTFRGLANFTTLSWDVSRYSSWFDCTGPSGDGKPDGMTDEYDRTFIQQHFGPHNKGH